MDNIKVTIRDRKYRNNFIEMSIDEYVDFIREQSTLLNIKEEEKNLNQNISIGRPETAKETARTVDITMKAMRNAMLRSENNVKR